MGIIDVRPRLARRSIAYCAMLTLASLFAPAGQAADDPCQAGAKSEWNRRLPSGVMVELLGVGDPSAKPQAWWSPNGKPLEQPIADVADMGVSKANSRRRAFAVRVRGPSINPTIEWIFDPVSGGTSGSAVRNGEQLSGVDVAVEELPVVGAKRDVRLRIAATDWTTEATHRDAGAADRKPKDGTVSFSQPRAVGDGTVLVVAENYTDHDTRIVAIGRDGKVHQCSSSDDHLGSAFRLHDLEFRGLKPDAVERFEFQVRRMETVEFKNVPLDAGKP
jgi:hypothetical protein